MRVSLDTSWLSSSATCVDQLCGEKSNQGDSNDAHNTTNTVKSFLYFSCHLTSISYPLKSTFVFVSGEVHLDRAHGLRGGGLHHALLGGLLLGAGGVSPRNLGRAALDPRHPRMAPGLHTGQARPSQARNRQPSIWVYFQS